MKTLSASTALALVMGLGVVGVNMAPAHAADAVVVAQAGGGAGGGGGGGAGAGSDAGTSAGGGSSGESGAIHPLEATGAETESAMRCDVDGDGFVNTGEARACYEANFGTISGGASHLSLDQFTGEMTEAGDAEATYAEIDADGDGQISQEEWLEWREAGFAEAAGAEGRMSVEDYERWERGGAFED